MNRDTPLLEAYRRTAERRNVAIGEFPDWVIRYEHRELRKCAVFLYAHVPDEQTGISEYLPVATGFLLAIPIEEHEPSEVKYLVTACHNVIDYRPDGGLSVRINTTDGSFVDRPIPDDAWIEDDKNDVAAAILAPHASYDVRFIPLDMVIYDGNPKYEPRFVWPGDDVAFIGWFSKYKGDGRNEPALRFGNVSLVPDSPVALDMPGPKMPKALVYIVEARSWGGQSGSPAFLDRPLGQGIGLLGLVHGHVQDSEEVDYSGDMLGKGRVKINLGMAIVVRAQSIMNLLLSDKMVNQRRMLWEEATADGGSSVQAD